MSPLPRTVVLDEYLYPDEALQVACEAFAGHCEIDVTDSGRQRLMTIGAKHGADANAQNEFLNYLLDSALESHLRRLAGRDK